MSIDSIVRRLSRLVFVGVLTGAVACAQPEPDVSTIRGASPLYAWLQYGADGLEARAIVEAGAGCTEVYVDGVASEMTERAPSGQDFPVVSCAAPVSASAGSISIGATTLPLPIAAPQRILVLGDTGCRMASAWFENCGGQGTDVPWSFPAAASSAAAEKPDLIVHVGDYVYREVACDTTQQRGCAGSPWGDKWATWEADFFAPSQPLLDVAPWVVTRGNHEDCGRNHMGWLRFLDGRPLSPSELTDGGCPLFPPAYMIALSDVDLLVLDTSTDPGMSGSGPSAKTHYVDGFTQAAALVSADRPTWTVTHRPFWGLAPDWRDPSKLAVIDTVLQAAIAGLPGGAWPAEVELALAGHIHLLETLSFSDGRPHQVISGDAGTSQDPPVSAQAIDQNPGAFAQLGISPAQFRSYHDFGYVLLERTSPSGWTVTVKDLAGDVLKQFVLRVIGGVTSVASRQPRRSDKPSPRRTCITSTGSTPPPWKSSAASSRSSRSSSVLGWSEGTSTRSQNTGTTLLRPLL